MGEYSPGCEGIYYGRKHAWHRDITIFLHIWDSCDSNSTTHGYGLNCWTPRCSLVILHGCGHEWGLIVKGPHGTCQGSSELQNPIHVSTWCSSLTSVATIQQSLIALSVSRNIFLPSSRKHNTADNKHCRGTVYGPNISVWNGWPGFIGAICALEHCLRSSLIPREKLRVQRQAPT
jgi:hypothetical protein